MAISIDTVYQKVLMLANKEQRGYITPQEFNLFADMAQQEIFEQYFYDLNQLLRRPSNSDEFADIPNNLREKISIFEIQNADVTSSSTSLPDDLYRLGMVIYDVNGEQIEVEEVERDEIIAMNTSALAKPTALRPVYTREGFLSIKTYPSITSNIVCNYTKKPTPPKWGYVVVSSKAMYDSSATMDFQLHESEEGDLVFKILQLAGITIKDLNLAQLAGQKEGSTIQQEKQ